MRDDVLLQNINHPGKTTRGSRAKYEAMREAMLALLPGGGPGLTAAEIRDGVVSRLPGDVFPGGATAGWWAKAVQLDLEARKIIVRDKGSPLRFRKA